jgi:hypothetical protein
MPSAMIIWFSLPELRRSAETELTAEQVRKFVTVILVLAPMEF